MLALVAPSSMTADQQELWLCAAVDALQGIRASEVRSVSAEVRRSVTRHNQIVPEIARLVAEDRSRQSRIREITRPLIEGPPPKKHIAERDRSKFTSNDWAELNEYLEKMGAKARYRPDGSRYFVEPA